MNRIPYLNIFIHMFDFKNKQNKHDFRIDYSIYFIIALILTILNFIFVVNRINNDVRLFSDIFIEKYTFIILELIAFFGLLTFLSIALFARRLNDIGFKKKSFLLLIVPFFGYLYIALLCFFVDSELSEEDKETKKKMTNKIFIYSIIVYVNLIIFGIVYVIRTYDLYEVGLNLSSYDPMYEVVKDENKYTDYKIEFDKYNYLPTLTELGDYNKMNYACKIIQDDAYITVDLKYDDIAFEDAKNFISSLKFINTPITNYDADKILFPVLNFTYKNYDFNILAAKGRPSFLFVGVNEDDNSIIYLFSSTLPLVVSYFSDNVDVRIKNMERICNYFYWFNEKR